MISSSGRFRLPKHGPKSQRFAPFPANKAEFGSPCIYEPRALLRSPWREPQFFHFISESSSVFHLTEFPIYLATGRPATGSTITLVDLLKNSLRRSTNSYLRRRLSTFRKHTKRWIDKEGKCKDDHCCHIVVVHQTSWIPLRSRNHYAVWREQEIDNTLLSFVMLC